MSAKLTITLKKSMIGVPEKQRAVVKGLGLRRLNTSVVLSDTPEIRGMIAKISHMLQIA